MGPPSILINSILCLFVYVSLVLSVSLSLSVSGFLSFFLLAWKKFAYLHLSCGASLSLYNFHPVSLCLSLSFSLSLNFFLSIAIGRKKDCIPAFKLWGLPLSLQFQSCVSLSMALSRSLSLCLSHPILCPSVSRSRCLSISFYCYWHEKRLHTCI